MEQWRNEPRFVRPVDTVMLQPAYIEIADTGDADSVNTVRHSLRRVPRGVRVVNVSLSAGSDWSWYRLATDDEWTRTDLTLRFTVANMRVLLEVF